MSTNKNYEKLYKDALERAKKIDIDEAYASQGTIAKTIFPELAESEDEVTRKWILDYLCDGLRKSDKQFKDQFKSAIAWLEKQKTCLADNSKTSAREDERIRSGLIRYLEAISYLEKQKESLPIPNKFSGLKSLMLQYLQSAANRKDDTEIESDTDLWGRKILDYVWKYSDEQKEQKPVERSLEDDHIIGFVYDLLNEIEWKDNWAMSKEECLRLLNNYRPQKPAE